MDNTSINKVKNEEFKIWKKTVPSLYNHITTRKPIYLSPQVNHSVNNFSKIKKTICFTDKVIPQKDSGILETSVLYSQGYEVFELGFELPLGAYAKSSERITDPKFNCDDKTTTTPLSAKWSYQGETISKLEYLNVGETTAIAMANTGSLAWFKDGLKVPIHAMQEIIGPGTSLSSIHSAKGGPSDINDFSISLDDETIIKTQSLSDNGSIIKLIDNAAKPGTVLRSINVSKECITHTIKYIDNNMFVTCSSDNIIRFWDTRGDDKPMFVLQDSKDGLLTSLDTTPLIDSLFITGSDTGVIKLWDVRQVLAETNDLSYRQHGEDPVHQELFRFTQSGDDGVSDVHFSKTSLEDFLTVGSSGNVYTWSLSPVLSGAEEAKDQDAMDVDTLNIDSLKFFHAGGNRNKKVDKSATSKRNTVAWHPVINDVVTTVEDDGLVTVYKPYLGRDFDDKE
ncbi:hypothetical protein TPHA_0D01130 [Tetrapisispora phaffii CBS 4417]|uniref:Uncharacterized protein n=1 Tax=Tetrapisispora phaffii (strain ATCC 24235 / CBS 4417 / NBRC 1672 / NRRL Y-8282 / UCD 70-5) TaxID=1071381 RepID=G8BSD3_TETPH|nr:hypothetical protein TPHA_0D01130 [Tetrapisispora phaffii CBS 4417]CCE62754.1 hypothetical protein TPHA_0D01130 [Tetrapisispora phaffii CBS 4417]